MEKNKILLVDDDEDIILAVRYVLEEKGYSVLAANDAPTAKKLLSSEVPDLVISDIMMPGESGFSLLTMIREQSGYKDIPVIIASSVDAETEVMKEGASAYLPKPFEPEELLKVVKELLSRENESLLMKKAVLLLKDSNYSEAEPILNQILELADQGTYPGTAAFYLGEIKCVAGKQESAEEYFKKSIQYNPQM